MAKKKQNGAMTVSYELTADEIAETNQKLAKAVWRLELQKLKAKRVKTDLREEQKKLEAEVSALAEIAVTGKGRRPAQITLDEMSKKQRAESGA